jgi:hypothetical protein
VPPFKDLHQALPHDARGGEARDVVPIEQDASLRHLAALCGQQIGDCLERGGFAGAVGSEQGHDLARSHLKRHADQRDDRVVIGDVDAVDREQRRHGRNIRRASRA